MCVRQGLKAFAHLPQLVSFQQNALEKPQVARICVEVPRSGRVQNHFDVSGYPPTTGEL